MCCGKSHSPWQIGISEAQRQAIYADEKWCDGNYNAKAPPSKGLAIARMMAMISYRSHPAYEKKFGRKIYPAKNGSEKNGPDYVFDVTKYLRYQGQKFLSRFDALSYVKLTRMMDLHDVGYQRDGGCSKVLRALGTKLPVLIFGVNSDALYPLSEQEELHRLIPNSQFCKIISDSGHDGFLLDQDQIKPVASKFLSSYAMQSNDQSRL